MDFIDLKKQQSKIREKIVGWKLIFDTPIMCNFASNEQVQEKKNTFVLKIRFRN